MLSTVILFKEMFSVLFVCACAGHAGAWGGQEGVRYPGARGTGRRETPSVSTIERQA